MEKDRNVPTLAHGMRALADLYVDLARLMARRLAGKSRWDRSWSYGPTEINRPDSVSSTNASPQAPADRKILRFAQSDKAAAERCP